MSYTAGIDVGSTYTKVVLLDGEGAIAARAMARTGFRLAEIGKSVLASALGQIGASEADIGYIISTGSGRLVRTLSV